MHAPVGVGARHFILVHRHGAARQFGLQNDRRSLVHIPGRIDTQGVAAKFQPGDPYTYLKCKGPNLPRGSFAYCNTLDKDANHYRYKEPDWFHGGKRPALYPWLALPKLGFSWKPICASVSASKSSS